MAIPFDLNVRLEDDGDNFPFDINERISEDHNTYGDVISSFVLFFLYSKQQRVLMFLIFFLLFWTYRF